MLANISVRTSSARSVVAALTAVLVVAAVGSTTTATASARPAQGQCGNVDANPGISTNRTTIGENETAVVTVTGTSYLLPPHQCGADVFGGVYLFFGWVQPGGQWGPSFRTSTSTQGLFGTSFSYPGEGGGGDTRDDGTGTVRLVSFTKGGESGNATDFHMDPSGNWQSNLTIRGAQYSFKDLRTGASNTVDCRIVQCGVFTIGAHGKASRTNERFTPINFTGASGAPIAPSNPGAGGQGGTTGAAPSSGTPSGASGDGAAAAEAPTGASPDTTASAGAVGSIGEAPDTTDAAEVESASERSADRVLDGEDAAAVQVFDDDDAGGSGGGLLVAGVVAAVLMLLAAAVAVVLRRRSAPSPEVSP